ncbi:MAG: hypothetical protein ABIM60_04760 [candidate division WOR-3 bacterium]
MKIINVPKVLREKLGDDGVDALIELLNASNEGLKVDLIELQTEKYERRLAEETAKLDKRITEEINRLRTEDIARLDKRITEETARLRVEISRSYANIIKWMFIFWVGQIGVITAILFTFLKFIR